MCIRDRCQPDSPPDHLPRGKQRTLISPSSTWGPSPIHHPLNVSFFFFLIRRVLDFALIQPISNFAHFEFQLLDPILLVVHYVSSLIALIQMIGSLIVLAKVLQNILQLLSIRVLWTSVFILIYIQLDSQRSAFPSHLRY
eukprot:TRINITY_DN20261_c0_g1_i2.p1 TRINITY_DN20261_c0_g1~~TRINITY_DN20261_c0_g1_i2.p1  ORF type:complete len:140 (+),score=10.35 TRINITY_DN20261_c0_g1_i2:58-477(+)